MSAEALPGGVQPVQQGVAMAAVRPGPALLNRLLAVAAAVFAVPLGLELHRWLGGAATPPADAVRLSVMLAAGGLALGFSLVVAELGRGTREFRLSRMLCGGLAGQALLLCALFLLA